MHEPKVVGLNLILDKSYNKFSHNLKKKKKKKKTFLFKKSNINTLKDSSFHKVHHLDWYWKFQKDNVRKLIDRPTFG